MIPSTYLSGRPAEYAQLASQGLTSGVFYLMVVKCFSESDPDIKDSQPAADSANEAVGNECPQSRVCHQQMVVGPFRSPGKNHEKHAYNGTDQPEHQHSNPMQPKLDTHVAVSSLLLGWYLYGCSGTIPAFRRRQLCPQRAWRNYLGCIRIRSHRTLLRRLSVAGRDLPKHIPSVRRWKPIRTFYDFRVLMRSATSR